MKIVISQANSKITSDLLINYYNFSESIFGKNSLKSKSLNSLIFDKKLNVFLDAFDYNYHFSSLIKDGINDKLFVILYADNGKILANSIIEISNNYLVLKDIIIIESYEDHIIYNIYNLFLKNVENYAKSNDMKHININLIDFNEVLRSVLFNNDYIFDDEEENYISFYKLIKRDYKIKEDSKIYDFTRRRNNTSKQTER